MISAFNSLLFLFKLSLLVICKLILYDNRLFRVRVSKKSKMWLYFAVVSAIDFLNACLASTKIKKNSVIVFLKAREGKWAYRHMILH